MATSGSHQHTLAIDFGSKYIGLALVKNGGGNQVLFAATITVEAKPLNALVDTRSMCRRMRRTKKTHKRRLRHLKQAIRDALPTISESTLNRLITFCRRRGFSYDVEEKEAEGFHIHRAKFFESLGEWASKHFPAESQTQVLNLCKKHLNAECQPSRELRPARFDNRGRARCQWEGCRHNVPRAGHDIEGRLRQSWYLWLQPAWKEIEQKESFQKSLEHWIRELGSLASALRKATDAKPIQKRINQVFKHLLKKVSELAPQSGPEFVENWKSYYRKNTMDVLKGSMTGRVQFCRMHSQEFVQHVLGGRAIPIQKDLSERDLISRKQQILFRRLWRYVEARILPLAKGRIDNLVVERVAFDVLEGPFKKRRDLSDAKAQEIYWYGPAAGFTNQQEMFFAEFGGICAYCGEQFSNLQIEHIFHQSKFPFNSYLNLVPACIKCNSQKGGRTLAEAQLTISDRAYEQYSKYLHKKGVLHPYHTIKKGLLNLLRRPLTIDRAEKMLAMIANNLVTISNTQRSPRPLARYLATRMEEKTGIRPATRFQAGRHTALYRSVILPLGMKEEQKESGDLRNHAIDAIILGCTFPSATALENPQWSLSYSQMATWQAKVMAEAPAMIDGMPKVETFEPIPNFEMDCGGGFIEVQLSRFNWNRNRRSGHTLDPYGKTKNGKAYKRQSATSILAKLVNPQSRIKQIATIAHKNLRTVLESNPEKAPESFVLWLQRSVEAGFTANHVSSHPADNARRQMLVDFANTPVADFFKEDAPAQVPWTIGVRCLYSGGDAKVNVPRANGGSKASSFHQAEPNLKYLIVNYPRRNGSFDRQNPSVFGVHQNDAVSQLKGRKWTALECEPESPLRGRIFGVAVKPHDFQSRWQEALNKVLGPESAGKRFHLAQGCLVEKMDGTVFQLVNFDISKPWMNADTFRDIRRVKRSPL